MTYPWPIGIPRQNFNQMHWGSEGLDWGMRWGGSRRVAVAGAAVVLACTVGLATTVSATPATVPSTPVKLDSLPGGWTEPRVVVGPDGTYWAVTNARSGTAVVYSSRDGGKHWAKTPADLPGQQAASADVDIVITHAGRIIITELDGAALKFITGYTDDRGHTWHQSTGTSIADTDRPWLAVGPMDRSTQQPRVYLLFHNLLTGALAHEMFVSTSTDGGATFGPPVPITLPGSQAFLDLQCGDSGAPSALAVDQRTGRIYAVFGTRTSVLGGCGASATGTFEINVVGETRIWVATSLDGSAGSWTDHLAYDAAPRTISASFETATIDPTGKLFIAFSETARGYPSFSEASVRYIWSGSEATAWARPVTVKSGSPVGTYDPTVVATGAGRLAIAYYQGSTAVPKPTWSVRLATVTDATGSHPVIRRSVLDSRIAYKETADAMGGSCSGSGPLAGVQNGFVCHRANDDFGLAVDKQCRLVAVYPMVATMKGTWATTRPLGSSCKGGTKA